MIRIPQVRVVDEEGNQLGVMATPEALELAQERGFDLVEVAPMSSPPVTRLLDYGQFKYEQARKEKEARRHQRSVEFKEVRLRVKIGKGDFDTKMRHLVEFIEEGQIDPDPLNLDPPEDIVVVTPISAKNSYSDVLPSANLRFEFNEKVVGRASIFRSVVRPRIEEVAFRVGIEDGEAEIGNPDLDPFRAWNLDASIAYYPTDLSVISAGVFYKRIEDFIFVQEIDDFEFAGRTFDPAVIALNGEDATVVGVELNYQQHFGFLNSPWDALLIGMNYTYVDSEADTGSREIALPKQSANIANVVLGYDKHGVDLRIAMKYRDRYIDELDEPGLDRYTDDHLQWDITAKYRFSDSWQVYAEIMNIGDEPEFYYAGNTNRALQYDEFGTTSAIGIQYNFSE